jgi:hypothetical protein
LLLNPARPAEVVRRIETCGARMVPKSVEAHPAYRAVLEQTLLSVARANGHASLKDARLRGHPRLHVCVVAERHDTVLPR